MAINYNNIDNGWDFLGYAAIGAAGGAIGMAGTPGNWALNTAIGASQGATVGGLNASLTEGDISAFGGGAKTGAIWGGAAGFASSEAPQNFIRGKGFQNNLSLFNELGGGSGVDRQYLIDRFGFAEGTYKPEDPYFISHNEAGAFTDPKTGNTIYGNKIFDSSYQQFRLGTFDELQHQLQFSKGELRNYAIDIRVDIRAHESSYRAAYRNLGLIGYDPNTSSLVMQRISRYSGGSFTTKWWHFIYKIPRRY